MEIMRFAAIILILTMVSTAVADETAFVQACRAAFKQLREDFPEHQPLLDTWEQELTQSDRTVSAVQLAFSKWLISSRNLKGWTQSDLEGRSNLAQSHISRLENSQFSVTSQTVAKIVSALEVPPIEAMDRIADLLEPAEKGATPFRDPSRYKSFGEWVREVRTGKGVTQLSLGSTLGINQSHIARIENGDLNVSLERAYEIGQSLGVSVRETFRAFALTFTSPVNRDH